MSEWKAPNRADYESVLTSDWFKNWLDRMREALPYEICLRNGNAVYYCSRQGNDFAEWIPLRLPQGPQLRLGLAPSNGHVPEPTPDRVAELIELVLREFGRLEGELNSLSAEILDKYEELTLLYDLSQSLGAQFDLKYILETVLERVEEALDVDRISVMLFNPETDELELVAARGFDPAQLKRHRFSVREGIAGYVLRSGKPLLVESLANLPEGIQWTPRKGYRSESFISVPMICSPLRVREIKIGVINVTEKRSREPFTSGDLKLLNTIASIASIAIYNTRLIEQAKENERIRKELEIAETIQMGLLPSGFPVLPDVEVYGQCYPAKNIGGDYFDFLIDDANRINLVVADVSGHNVSAALMMAVTRSALRSLMHRSVPVSEVLRQANQLLFEDMNRAGFFISLFYLRYDRHDRRVYYANGGHHPVFWYRAAKKEIRFLDSDGLLLGIMPQVEFEERVAQAEQGDLFVMYTDGLIEATNSEGILFGHERLKQSILRYADLSAEEMVHAVMRDLKEYTGKKTLSDDVTLQVLKVCKKG